MGGLNEKKWSLIWCNILYLLHKVHFDVTFQCKYPKLSPCSIFSMLIAPALTQWCQEDWMEQPFSILLPIQLSNLTCSESSCAHRPSAAHSWEAHAKRKCIINVMHELLKTTWVTCQFEFVVPIVTAPIALDKFDIRTRLPRLKSSIARRVELVIWLKLSLLRIKSKKVFFGRFAHRVSTCVPTRVGQVTVDDRQLIFTLIHPAGGLFVSDSGAACCADSSNDFSFPKLKMITHSKVKGASQSAWHWLPSLNDFPVKMASQPRFCRRMQGRLLNELPGPWESQSDVSEMCHHWLGSAKFQITPWVFLTKSKCASVRQLGSPFGWEAAPHRMVFLQTCLGSNLRMGKGRKRPASTHVAESDDGVEVVVPHLYLDLPVNLHTANEFYAWKVLWFPIDTYQHLKRI